MPYPNPLIVLLKGNQTLTVENVASETTEAVTYSDATTYRNELPAAYIGRAWGNYNDFDIANPGGFPAAGAAENEDDRVNATVPFNLTKTRTLLKFLDAGAAVVGKCWYDQFIGFGSSADFID